MEKLLAVAVGLQDMSSVSKQKVKPLTKQIKVPDHTFTYSFPPHSFTQIKLKLSL